MALGGCGRRRGAARRPSPRERATPRACIKNTSQPLMVTNACRRVSNREKTGDVKHKPRATAAQLTVSISARSSASTICCWRALILSAVGGEDG